MQILQMFFLGPIFSVLGTNPYFHIALIVLISIFILNYDLIVFNQKYSYHLHSLLSLNQIQNIHHHLNLFFERYILNYIYPFY
jgi:hypothetical protein